MIQLAFVSLRKNEFLTRKVIILSMISIWFSQLNNINSLLRKEYIKSLKSLKSLSHDITNTINNT